MNAFIAYGLALYFWWSENAYFGWNARPSSDGELIADGFVIFLFAFAILIQAVDARRK